MIVIISIFQSTEISEKKVGMREKRKRREEPEFSFEIPTHQRKKIEKDEVISTFIILCSISNVITISFVNVIVESGCC